MEFVLDDKLWRRIWRADSEDMPRRGLEREHRELVDGPDEQCWRMCINLLVYDFEWQAFTTVEAAGRIFANEPYAIWMCKLSVALALNPATLGLRPHCRATPGTTEHNKTIR